MKVAHLDGVSLAYELIGAGEPLLLIHGSNLADGLSPLASALAREAPWLRVLRYHRRGYGGTAAVDVPASVDQHAADALGLLDSLGMRSAHVLGYSYGGVVALEAALMAPTRIRSLTLLEPILLEVPSAGDFVAGMAPVMSRYTDGDMEGAVTATLAALGGPKWQDLIATIGPGALDMAILDTVTYYRSEAPSLNTWTLTPAAPRRSTVGCCRCWAAIVTRSLSRAEHYCISASRNAPTSTSRTPITYSIFRHRNRSRTPSRDSCPRYRRASRCDHRLSRWARRRTIQGARPVSVRRCRRCAATACAGRRVHLPRARR